MACAPASGPEWSAVRTLLNMAHPASSSSSGNGTAGRERDRHDDGSDRVPDLQKRPQNRSQSRGPDQDSVQATLPLPLPPRPCALAWPLMRVQPGPGEGPQCCPALPCAPRRGTPGSRPCAACRRRPAMPGKAASSFARGRYMCMCTCPISPSPLPSPPSRLCSGQQKMRRVEGGGATWDPGPASAR